MVARSSACQWWILLLFSDESWFHNSDTVNQHIIHYWSIDNPHWDSILYSGGVNVWCGILGEHMIGPHFFEGNLNKHQYLQFLQNDLPVLLEEIPLWTRLFMWYQHDRDPLHCLVNVWNHLNETYLRRWIGRIRLLDLTPPDLFLWGYLKKSLWATAKEYWPSETPYYRGTQNNHTLDVVTHEKIPAVAFAGMYYPKRSPVWTPATLQNEDMFSSKSV